MMKTLRLTAMVIFALSVVCGSAWVVTRAQNQDRPATKTEQAQDKEYWALTQKYCNARFGFCVYYPASVGWRDEKGVWHSGDPKTGPENNDGNKFDNGNGLEVTVSGINNASNDTLESEMTAAEKRFDKVLFREKRKNSFIVKGQKGDSITYLRTYLGSGSINHLEIHVPVGLHAEYSEVMSNIAGSFSPGNLSIAH